MADGELTGRVIGPIVNRERKRDLMESLCQTMRIGPEQARAPRRPRGRSSRAPAAAPAPL